MSKPAELLDSRFHRHLRLLRRRSADLGDAVMSSPLFPSEFRSASAYYPIFFQTTVDGASVQPIALFGFEDGQNLFLGPRGWDAPYVPMAIEREPFMIGRVQGECLITLDRSSPRLSDSEGDPLFGPHGQPTELMERINSLLAAVHDGVQALPEFVEALGRHQLLESFSLDVDLEDGASHRLSGLMTIHEERLAALEPAALAELHQAGHLMPIYMAVASMARLRDLIDRLERRRRLLAVA